MEFVSTFHCMKKYPAIYTESRMSFGIFTKWYLYVVQLYLGLSNHFEKKVSHNDMTSYCHQHILCNYMGGGRREPQVPLSSFLTAAAYLFCFVFVSFPFHLYKKFEELDRSTSSITDIKMRVSSPLLSVSYSIVLSLPFFFLFFISLGAKEQGKAISTLSLQLP